ncbi:MAG: PleD family two-component system response regulator [Acidimicrobiales bacterium]
MSSILIIDDDADIRLLLRLELSAEGHHITEAVNGRDGLEAIAADRPDLVLLDIMMPVLDGWGVLEALDPAEAPPIVVVTALASDGDRHIAELLEAGAVDVISKPFDPGWLMRLVDAVVLVEPEERDEYRRRRLARAQRP